MPKRMVVAVPKDLHEAAKFLAEMGKAQRASDKIKSALNADVEKLTAKAMDDDKPHQEKITELLEGLFAYAEANRDELTDHGKCKTVAVPTGTISWRMTPPAVKLKDVPKVLESLKELRLKRFIRTKEEVDKEAMLKEPEVAQTVKGVTIGQHEEFVAKPHELEVEVSINRPSAQLNIC